MYLSLSLRLIITSTVFPLPCFVTLWHHNVVRVPSHMAQELHWGTRDRKMKEFCLKMYNPSCFGNIPPSLNATQHFPLGVSCIHFCRGPIEWTPSSTFWMLTPPSASLCLIHVRVSFEFLPAHNPFQLLLPLSSLPIIAKSHVGINYLHVLTSYPLFKPLQFGFLRNHLSPWISHWLLILLFCIHSHPSNQFPVSRVTLLKIQTHLLHSRFKTLQHLPLFLSKASLESLTSVPGAWTICLCPSIRQLLVPSSTPTIPG